MKIKDRISLLMLCTLTLLALLLVGSGYLVITGIIYRDSTTAFTRDLANINLSIGESYNELEDAGLLGLKSYVTAEKQRLLKLLTNYQFGKTGQLYILDEQGRVVLHNRLQAGERLQGEFVEEMLAGKSGNIEYRHEGLNFFSVYRPSDHWDWLLVLSITKAELLAQRGPYLVMVGVASAFSLLLVTFLLRALFLPFMQRIERITNCLQAVKQGDFNVRLTRKSDDEVGIIETGINSMIETVSLKTEQLESSVRERTDDLLASEQKFRHLVESTRVVPWELDLASRRFTYMAPQVEELFGYPASSWSGLECWIERVNSEDRGQVQESVDSCRRHGEDRDFEYRAHATDGSIRWIHSIVSYGTGENNKGKLFGCWVDISAIKQAEVETARLATAIEQAAEGIIVADNDWLVRYVNPAYETITGFSRDELMNKDIRHSQNGTDDMSRLRQVVTMQGLWQGRLFHKRKDGSEYQAETTMSAVKDNKNRIINYVLIHRDISREARLEEQLNQSQKMEAIGTLAGGIAHDFNNILSAVVGYTQLAQLRHKDDVKLQRYLTEVYNAGNRATDLVKQILTFSRQGEHEKKPLQINLVVKEALKLLRASLPTTIEIAQDLETKAIVMADATQIHQVLMNLCTNASLAMRETGGILEVKLTELDLDDDFCNHHPGLKPGSHLRLTVGDNGIGMSAEVQARMFEPFFTTREKGEGTGLGLSVVHGIISKHNGSISVYSEVGKGTTFSIYLPCMYEHAFAGKVAEVELKTGTEHILFVDDEQFQVDLAGIMLPTLGYRVTTTTSSTEALEMFRADPDSYDLVITDMTMPNMTGDQLARQLLEIRPDLPIILCTGYSERMTEEKARGMGIKRFAMKPVVIGEISETIRSALDNDISG
jgi:PAS domain S-box-containing protein